MQAVRIPEQQRLILENVTWSNYTRLLRVFSDRHLRLTYDRGILEIATLSYQQEMWARFLGRLVIVLTSTVRLYFRAW